MIFRKLINRNPTELHRFLDLILNLLNLFH